MIKALLVCQQLYITSHHTCCLLVMLPMPSFFPSSSFVPFLLSSSQSPYLPVLPSFPQPSSPHLLLSREVSTIRLSSIMEIFSAVSAPLSSSSPRALKEAKASVCPLHSSTTSFSLASMSLSFSALIHTSWCRQHNVLPHISILYRSIFYIYLYYIYIYILYIYYIYIYLYYIYIIYIYIIYISILYISILYVSILYLYYIYLYYMYL